MRVNDLVLAHHIDPDNGRRVIGFELVLSNWLTDFVWRVVAGFLFLNVCSTTTSDLTEIDGIEFEAKSVASRISQVYKTAK